MLYLQKLHKVPYEKWQDRPSYIYINWILVTIWAEKLECYQRLLIEELGKNFGGGGGGGEFR